MEGPFWVGQLHQWRHGSHSGGRRTEILRGKNQDIIVSFSFLRCEHIVIVADLVSENVVSPGLIHLLTTNVSVGFALAQQRATRANKHAIRDRMRWKRFLDVVAMLSHSHNAPQCTIRQKTCANSPVLPGRSC
jgi:hypothetical protein